MPQHISLRVPWHDHGWDGTVCADPLNNNACLRLKNISENRDDKTETAICGHCMADHSDILSCISEGSAFMSAIPMVRSTVHPYKTYRYPTHQHFLPTDITYPAYSFPARPFAWLICDNINNVKDIYNIDFIEEREPVLKVNTIWVQEADNQKAIFDYFYGDIIENESLCIAYAKQVPFVEDKVDKVKKEFVTSVNNENKMYPPLYLTPIEYEADGKHILYVRVPVSQDVCRCNSLTGTTNPILILRIIQTKYTGSMPGKVAATL